MFLKKHKVVWLIGMILLGVMFFIGCGQESANKSGEDASTAKKKITIAYLTGDQLHQYALPIAIDKGYFEEEGIETELMQFQAGGNVTQQFHEIDIGMVGMNPAIIGRAQGLDLVVFQSLNHGGSALVVHPSISKFEDLENKAVATPGVAAIQHNLYTQLEKRYNAKTNKVSAAVTDMPILAQNDEIVGAIGWEPWPTVVMEIAGWKRLFASNDIMENQQCCTWITSEDFMKNNPEVIEKLCKINLKATKYITDYPEEAIEIIARHAGRDISTIQKAFENMIYPWPPKINEASSKLMIQNLVDQDIIEAKSISPDLDTWYEGLVDEHILDTVIQSDFFKKLESEGVPK